MNIYFKSKMAEEEYASAILDLNMDNNFDNSSSKNL